MCIRDSYRSGHLQNILSVDPYVLENISVLHGPSSVFYGSGALGGAITGGAITAAMLAWTASDVVKITKALKEVEEEEKQ